MDAKGALFVEPENHTEAYALKHWLEKNSIPQQDHTRIETLHFRGSGLIITTTIQEDKK